MEGSRGPAPGEELRDAPHGHVHRPPRNDEPDSVYDWRIHHPIDGKPDRVAVEVSPKRGLLPRWRFVVPGNWDSIISWGVGPPGGGPINTSVKRPAGGGPVNLVNGPLVSWFGGHEALSSRLSAYLVFEGDPPQYLAFGQANEPGGPPARLEGISFAHHAQRPHSHGDSDDS